MEVAPIPQDESDRLRALRELDVLDSGPEPEFDALVRAASAVARTPISLISLVDHDRQWFKAKVGLDGVSETGRDVAFCSHAILGAPPLEVKNASTDPRFHDNPLVVNAPHIRFYCGVPIKLTTGEQVGTLCVIDDVPRQLDERQRKILEDLAVAAASALEGRKAAKALLIKSRALIRNEKALWQANHQLQRANEELRTFVRVASHDLKSPMLTIARLAEWTIEELGGDAPEDATEYLGLIRTRVARLETLIEDLRAYATLGAERAPSREIDLKDLLQRTFDLNEGSSDVQFVVDSDLERLTTQVAPLEIVLRNLLGNAIKHGTCAEPRIVARVRCLSDLVEFSITDNGAGIKPEFHGVIFDLLRSLKSRDEVEGSGMGLALAKKAVDQAGGEISLESDGIHGTTFRFTWPSQAVLDPVAGTT